MILAEDLLLLFYDDESGRPIVDSAKVDMGLAGAVLLDLAMHERVAVAGYDEQVRAGRLYVTDPTPVGDPILDDGLAQIAEKDGRRTAKTVLRAVKTGLRARLLDRMSERGILEHEEQRALGLFPVHRWPAVDTAHEREVRQRLEAVLAGAEPDARTAALVALVYAVDAVTKVAYTADRRTAKRRAKNIAEGAWAADAVRKAIQDVQAATTAAIMATTSWAVMAGGNN